MVWRKRTGQRFLWGLECLYVASGFEGFVRRLEKNFYVAFSTGKLVRGLEDAGLGQGWLEQ